MYKLNSGSNELEIDAWFPTLIGVSFYKDHKKDAPSIIKQFKDVKSKCPQSIGQPSFFLHACHKDKKLKNLNNWIQERVNDLLIFTVFPKKLNQLNHGFIGTRKII